MKGRTLVRPLARSAVLVGTTPRLHLRDSRRAQVEVQRHRVRPQHLLPQILQPGVDGGVGPAESRCTPLWGPCSHPGPQEGTPTPRPTHPSSCWSSPRHTGRRALPPSCSSRRCSFLATKLNLQRRQSWCCPGPAGMGGTRPEDCTGWGLPSSAGSLAGSLKDSASLGGAEASLARPMGVPGSGNRRLHYALNKTPRPSPDEGHKATHFPSFPPGQLQASGCIWLWRHLYPATPPSALSCRLRGFHVSGTPRYVYP